MRNNRHAFKNWAIILGVLFLLFVSKSGFNFNNIQLPNFGQMFDGVTDVLKSDNNQKSNSKSKKTGSDVKSTVLSGVEQADQAKIQELINSVKVAEPTKVKYVRSEWDGDAILTERDGKSYSARDYNLYFSPFLEEGSPATKDSIKYLDPYTNQYITSKKLIDRDHIIPLGYVHQHGGSDWDKAKKNQYAFDVTVSVDVHRTENRSKSDKGPAEYMPPANKEAYAYSWLVIANKYGIAISKADLEVIKETLKDTQSVSIINPHN